jgi:hypothetical protein
MFTHYGESPITAAADMITDAGPRLRLVPEVGEAGEAQAPAHRLHPQPLVIRCNGT